MTGFNSKRQQQQCGFPSHHTTSTLSPPSKGCKKMKEEDDSRCVGDEGCEITKIKGKGVKGQNVVATVDENEKQMKNATNVSSRQDDAEMKLEDVAKMSIQSQSEPQPQRGMRAVMCTTSAEAKQDVNDESGRLAASKSEVEQHLLLPSKQAIYGNGENYTEEPTSEKKTVSSNVDHQTEVLRVHFYCSVSSLM